MSTFPTHAFSLEYRPDLGVLIGRWLQAMPPPEVQGTYQAMLAAAKEHGNCRFWLLDLRRRPLDGPDLNEWFRDQFSPQVTAELGGPLFTAYLSGPHQRQAAESEEMEERMRQAAAIDSYPLFYDNEAEAMNWLHDQQERAGMLPADEDENSPR
ncbi:hypothetical protein Q5H92_01135 [Hymenobacter sp. M29]|uniref:STAS/SEC14 domain-containing protein n=1 Tax=Hymenobacter mellowenesis TaxID=3063995 RepID=A0ABT9A535_9BACT|nr:hypothetical protein [Hymenobacter sp. M29]MDO7844944.1 hypothetical protein [Hymenobacter sp. M29]